MKLSSITRTPRYRIRTLLILTTIAALHLGWTTFNAEKRQNAIELLKANHAHIEFGDDLAGSWWSRGFLDDDLFRVVIHVTLLPDSPTPMDELLSELRNLPEIARLELIGSATDHGLHQVAQLQNLRQLLIFHCRGLTNEGFSRLGELKRLKYIMIDGLAIDDGVLVHLAEILALDAIRIEHTQISADGIANLRRRLPDTKIIYNESILVLGV